MSNALTLVDGLLTRLCRSGAALERSPVKFKELPKDSFLADNESSLGFIGIERDRGGKNWVTTLANMPEALELARAMFEVLIDGLPTGKLFQFPPEEMLVFVKKSVVWRASEFVRNAKYLTVWPLAYFMRQEAMPVPPREFEGIKFPLLFEGRIRKILKIRLISRRNPKNLSLFSGILQGVKRAAATVSSEFVKETMLKHRAALTTECTTSCETLDEFEPLVDKLLAGFRTRNLRLSLFEASTSASWERSRGEGGARDFLRSTFGAWSSSEFLRIHNLGPGVQVEARGVWTPDVEEVLSLAEQSSTSVMVCPILEPLKVRLITKGSAPRQWFSRFLQKELWRYLFEMPQFSLIGTPINTSHLEWMMERERYLNLDEKFDKFVSGDYSAATDGLSIKMTKLVFESIIEFQTFGLTNPFAVERVKSVLRSVLYEQQLHYPDKFNHNGDLDPIEQRTGQLMGSVLSFPILCIINLLGYWNALILYLVEIGDYACRDDAVMALRFEELPVLINGDDILFRANDRFYEIWKEQIHAVGFSLSIGKNYIHPSILTINSQVFVYDGVCDHFKRVPLLNAGLLIGKNTGRMTARASPIWSLYNECVPNAVDPVRAHRRFLHYHIDLVRDLTWNGKFNLVGDQRLGALGFTECYPVTYTPFQRALSVFLLREFKLSLRRSCRVPTPLHGVSIDRPKPRVLQWRFGSLHLWPLTTPPLAGYTVHNEQEVFSLPLELDEPVVDKSADLRYIRPKKAVIAAFKESLWDLRNPRILTWNRRVYSCCAVHRLDS